MPIEFHTNFGATLHQLAAVHTPDGFVTAIVASVIGAGVTFAALLLAIGAASHLGRGTQAMVTRFILL
jgi:hypothetical protein